MKKAFLVVGLGYGDEGKGTTVEYLTKKHTAHTVVRYNGGAQAGHNVVTDDGKHHTFSQFGSGTFVGAKTYLSRHVIVEPMALLNEGRHLQELGVSDVFERIAIDRDALLITPYHQAANVLWEALRGAESHGSCGMGIGETVGYSVAHGPDVVPRMRDLENLPLLLEKLEALRAYQHRVFLSDEVRKYLTDPYAMQRGGLAWERLKQSPSEIIKQYEGLKLNLVDGDYFERLMRQDGAVVFEGAQGVMLDENYGFHPHTTWSNCTLSYAFTLLAGVRYEGDVDRVGVLRTYSTRHGNGPFVPGNIPNLLPHLDGEEQHNSSTSFQGAFRIGPLDTVALRYALDVVGGVDYLSLTHLDSWSGKMCSAYEGPDEEKNDKFFISPNRIRMANIGEGHLYPDDLLSRQEELGKYLRQCTPILKTMYCVEDIEEALGVQTGIVSFGPSLRHKAAANVYKRRVADVRFELSLKA